MSVLRSILCVPVGLAFLLGAPSPSDPPAETAVLGSIEATVDGEVRTWYVVRGTSGEHPYASATWWETDDGQVFVNIGGFDTEAPPLDTFEFDPAFGPTSFGDYEGGAIDIVLIVADGMRSIDLALGDGAGGNSIVVMPVVSPDFFLTAFVSGSGALRAEVGEPDPNDGTLSLTGEFSGVFELVNGNESIQITAGRFDVVGIPNRDALSVDAAAEPEDVGPVPRQSPPRNG